MDLAGRPDTDKLEAAAAEAAEMFQENRDELINIIAVIHDQTKSAAVEEIRTEVRKLKLFKAAGIIEANKPEQVMTRDTTALGQGLNVPHHVRVSAWLLEQQLAFQSLDQLGKLAKRVSSYLRRQEAVNGTTEPVTGHCIFKSDTGAIHSGKMLRTLCRRG